jgi:hypothetical protein
MTWAPLLAAARAERGRFAGAVRAPRSVQLALLRQILATNRASAFGRQHGFDGIRSIEAFRAQVPIRDYEGHRSWIDRVASGGTGTLTSEPIIAYEETGGSRSGGKLIPYTGASLQAFRAAVLPWLGDLATLRPATFAGRAYMAVSPVARAARATAGGIPIGLPCEGAYLGADLAPALAAVLAVPPAVAGIRDVDFWRFLTLRFLLSEPDLSFISVWSPTFLIGLLQALTALAEPLMRAVRDGVVGVADLPFAAPQFAPDRDRAHLIGAALSRHPIAMPLLWPRLATVSAWADGASRGYAQTLRGMFPNAELQPKGLLATEGPVTVPWHGSGFSVPALTSTFLEFIDEAGRPLLCDQLHDGSLYRVVMTTPGGLYRYDLGDRVRCRGHVDRLPRLEFIGRAGVASDIVGEKLCDDFVAQALSDIDGAACLVAHATKAPFYELLVAAPADENLAPLAVLVEERLRANPQYAYARALGQLGPVAPRAVDRLLERYMGSEARRGRRLTDIKPPTLISDMTTYAALIGLDDTRRVPDISADAIHAPTRRSALLQGAAE